MIKKNTLTMPVLLFAILIAFSCSKKQAEEIKPESGGSDAITADNVTFTNYIKGLIESNCSSCHAGSNPEASAQFRYDGYNSVVNNAARINDAVIVRKIMPQGGSLPNKDIMLLKAWIDKGMPQ